MRGSDLENIHRRKIEPFSQVPEREGTASAQDDIASEQTFQNALKSSATLSEPQRDTFVASQYSARPVNCHDTVGINPIINAGSIVISPANIPLVFEYSVQVPKSRTYILREFYCVPTKIIVDENNNPINDLFTLSFFIDDIPVQGNANLTFPSWGTGDWQESFFIAKEESIVRLRAEITNPAYVDLEPPFDLEIACSMLMRFNSLLDDGREPNFQIANKVKKFRSSLPTRKRFMS